MKTLREVYTEYKKSKNELETKKAQYNNLSQIERMDSPGKLLDCQILVLKGVVKALEWVMFQRS